MRFKRLLSLLSQSILRASPIPLDVYSRIYINAGMACCRRAPARRAEAPHGEDLGESEMQTTEEAKVHTNAVGAEYEIGLSGPPLHSDEAERILSGDLEAVGVA